MKATLAIKRGGAGEPAKVENFEQNKVSVRG